MKAKFVSSVVIAISACWEAYSFVTTVETIPSEWGKFAKMMADPPDHLPLIITVAAIGVLLWSLVRPEKPLNPPLMNNQVNQTHNGQGDNIVSDTVNIRKE